MSNKLGLSLSSTLFKHKTSLSFIIQLMTGSPGHVPRRHSPEDPELLATLGLLHLQVLMCHSGLLS